jgi:lincosamide nucleotidyltransferase A/C/D/E
VDALVGRQIRPHADLDLAVRADHLAATLEILDRLGFAAVVNWLPVRVELAHPDGRRVDLHPLRFRPDGSAVQAGPDGTTFRYTADGFVTSVVAGREVGCLSAAQQLEFREGNPRRAWTSPCRPPARAGGRLGPR